MSGDRVFSLIGAGSGAVGIIAAIFAAAIGRRTTRGIRETRRSPAIREG